jgi:hypothetical protein
LARGDLRRNPHVGRHDRLLPAWQATKESIAPSLGRDRKMRCRRALVTGQVALSLIVLATGFLFLRNLFRASQISPGFDLRHTIRARVNLPAREYKEFKQVDSYAGRGVGELEAVPGRRLRRCSVYLAFQSPQSAGRFQRGSINATI